MKSFYFGHGNNPAEIILGKLNRHGIIAGATGTGKTVTLKVLAEKLSDAGIPVFLSDIKGDLTSLASENTSDNLEERLKATKYNDYEPKSYPVELWDVEGKNGTPVRMTISEMGPILLSRILGLNDTQESILNIVFDIADKKGLLLIDLQDLRSMLNFVSENSSEFSSHYGNIHTSSIGAILRSLVIIEKQGGDIFFSEPSLEISDIIRTDRQGRGIINILSSERLFNQPVLYATVLLSLLSEMYENLPEVGDLDKPKLVFFFDEAHTLFKDAPTVLLDKIELVVRLIRSKGVSIFFVTQNPMDIPNSVSSQLGNRIQHGLRAFTPKELKVVSSVAETFRQDKNEDLAKVIQELKIGEAVVSTLQEDGTPSFADKVLIYPPQSSFGVVDPSVKLSLINKSSLLDKYSNSINRISAYEQLEALNNKKEVEEIQLIKQAPIKQTPVKEKREPSYRRTDTMFDRMAKNAMSQVGRELGRILTRGITGMLKK